MLQAERHPVEEIVHASVRPVLLPLAGYTFAEFLFQALEVDEAKVQRLAVEPCEVIAPVGAGGFDAGTRHARFVYIKFSPVKATEIIDHADHEFQWVMRLEVQALVAFYGVAG